MAGSVRVGGGCWGILFCCLVFVEVRVCWGEKEGCWGLYLSLRACKTVYARWYMKAFAER